MITFDLAEFLSFLPAKAWCLQGISQPHGLQGALNGTQLEIYSWKPLPRCTPGRLISASIRVLAWIGTLRWNELGSSSRGSGEGSTHLEKKVWLGAWVPSEMDQITVRNVCLQSIRAGGTRRWDDQYAGPKAGRLQSRKHKIGYG